MAVSFFNSGSNNKHKMFDHKSGFDQCCLNLWLNYMKQKIYHLERVINKPD